MKAVEIRPGMAVSLEGNLWLVVNYNHVKPGKGGAFAVLKLKNVKTGQNVEKRFRSAEDLDQVNLDKREMQFLYADGEDGVFMDNETFEQVTIPSEVLGEALLYILPNANVTGLVHDGTVITIELPSVVDLKVEDTPPGIKGATATNQLKEATLETGLKTRVPPFIANGETVRVSTEDGSYLSRVSGD